MSVYDVKGNKISSLYNCRDYGITPDNADNTLNMRKLMMDVYNSGGGTIYIPIGEYNFNCSSAYGEGESVTRLLPMYSGVSIIGESEKYSSLKVSGNSASGCALFAKKDETLCGCDFKNFTVDMSECTVTTYSYKGKAFYCSAIQDSVFRDLRLIGAPATALGIDRINRVTIDSIYVYQGGRLWTSGGYGGAGIGIGSSDSDIDEPFIIRNCICDDCGNFGIFIEQQGGHAVPNSRCQIIANNIVMNGRGSGIGLRTSKDVVISGNNIRNCKTGILVDSGATDSTITGNQISDCTNGFEYANGANVGNGTSTPCNNISVLGNVFIGNENSIVKTIEPTNSIEANNIINGVLT